MPGGAAAEWMDGESRKGEGGCCREAVMQRREFLSPLGWSGLTFGAAKQCRKAGTNIEQASPSGAAGGGRIKAETGDKGLSATGTNCH